MTIATFESKVSVLNHDLPKDRIVSVNQLQRKCIELYGNTFGSELFIGLAKLIDDQRIRKGVRRSFTERDAVLITHGALIDEPTVSPLRTLAAVSEKHLAQVFNIMHILPFRTCNTNGICDDTNLRSVRPKLGTWDDINTLSKQFQLVFDIEISQYNAPAQLLNVVDRVLHYVGHSAYFVCLNFVDGHEQKPDAQRTLVPQFHLVVEIIRLVLDITAPYVSLIVKSKVFPQADIGYFSRGINEGQLIINHELPSLVLHTIQTGDATTISDWAANFRSPTTNTTFFNYLDSPEGIDLTSLRRLLNPHQFEQVITRSQKAGEKIEFQSQPNEQSLLAGLNLDYYDALASSKADGLSLARFVAAHAIMLSLVGVPGIYLHSILGSINCAAGINLSEPNSSNTREHLDKAALDDELATTGSRRSRILRSLTHLLSVRASTASFDPYGQQKIIKGIPTTLIIQRKARESRRTILCLINVTNQITHISLPWRSLLGTDRKVTDLVSGGQCLLHGLGILLQPYQVRWLTP